MLWSSTQEIPSFLEGGLGIRYISTGNEGFEAGRQPWTGTLLGLLSAQGPDKLVTPTLPSHFAKRAHASQPKVARNGQGLVI